MAVSVEQSVESLTGKTRVIGEKLPQYQVGRHKTHIILLGLETGPAMVERQRLTA